MFEIYHITCGILDLSDLPIIVAPLNSYAEVIFGTQLKYSYDYTDKILGTV